jgi:hypothetical protein
MGIKKDLDYELIKRISDKQKQLDLVKESHEEDITFLLNYLKENDIINKLEDIARWAREKGFTKILYESRKDEGHFEDFYYYNYIFYIWERRFLFREFHHAVVTAEVTFGNGNYDRVPTDERKVIWTVELGGGEDIGRHSGKNEKQMFELLKKYFIDLVDSKTERKK